MADDERNLAPVYIGIGVLAAVGVGYLLWRFALRDEQTRERAATAIRKAGHETAEWSRQAAGAVRDAVKGGR